MKRGPSPKGAVVVAVAATVAAVAAAVAAAATVVGVVVAADATNPNFEFVSAQ